MKVSQNKTEMKNTDFKNKARHILICLIAVTFMIFGPLNAVAQQQEMMVRIAEIEINPENLSEYMAILKEEASASIKLEPGVIAIFPMHQKENPAQVRILEIYRDKAAYEQHLKTPHFQKYKTTTVKMVKSLKLTEMETLDRETMDLIFEKLKVK